LRELCQRLPMSTVIFSGRWPRARLFADHLLTLQQGKLLPADDPS
ncbi:MAG: hypothetical protein HQL55_16065, partial [Magnetococcales bacterium]|nr:hypothetical protein [Magnetococcales bacterium]